MLRIEAGVDLNAGHAFKVAHVPIAQVTKSSRFALHPNTLVEGECLRNGVVVARGMRADLFELANVFIHVWRGGHQRPSALDLVAPHVEETRPVRGKQPLVERRAVAIAVQIGSFERKVGVGVGPVHNSLDASGPRHLAYLLYRKDLAAQVGNVAAEDHLGSRRNRLLEDVDQVLHARRRRRERHLLQHEAFTAHPLFPGREHTTVVLIGGQDLIPGIQVDAHLRYLERLARVARNGHLLGVTSEIIRQTAANALDLWFEDLPHRVDGRCVRVIHVTPQRVLDDLGCRAHSAVVEID